MESNFMTSETRQDEFILVNNNQLKDFQCPICSKYFSRKFTLDMHLLIHKGVKPHPCPFCGKCFRQKGTLMRHKALHSTNNLFHCNLCDRGFRQKNVFLHHLKHRHYVSTETLDRRKYRTELKDYQSIMDTLPPFVLADSTAIASSEKHLDAMLYESLNNSFCDSSVAEGNSLESDSDDQKFKFDSVVDSASHWSGGSALNQNLRNDSNAQLRYRCGLCLEWFTEYSTYIKHIEEKHDNVEMLLDSKPIIFSVPSPSKDAIFCLKPTRNISESFSNETDIPILNKNVTANTNLDKVSSSNSANDGRDVNLCIPCHKGFVNEEFESHAKTSVRGVLNDQNLLSRVNDKSVANEMTSVSRIAECCISNINLCDNSTNLIRPIGHSEMCFEEHISSSIKKSSTSTLNGESSSSDGHDKEISGESSLDETGFKLKFSKPAKSLLLNSTKSIKSRGQSYPLYIASSNHCSKNLTTSKLKGSSVRYKCKTCNQLFKKKGSFQYHKQMHLNVRGFKCSYCKKSFTSKHSLLSHTRCLHLKTFCCSSCSRLFSYRSLYKYHIKNCPQKDYQEKNMKNIFNLPIVKIQELMESDANVIIGAIPICDKERFQTADVEFCIPIVSLVGLRELSNNPFLKSSLQINGDIK